MTLSGTCESTPEYRVSKLHCDSPPSALDDHTPTNSATPSLSETPESHTACKQASCDNVSDVNLASRKANEAVARRFQAAAWLHKMVGPLPDLPLEPSEEELRLSLRNGLVLCNLINKIHPGAVLKVVENPAPSSPPPQGAALSAYQYFENVRNFLVAVDELKLPSFQASDLDNGSLQAGSSSAKVVDCILALKAYQEWQLNGGQSLWKFAAGTYKSPCTLKSYTRAGSAKSGEHQSSRLQSQFRKRWPFDGPNKNLFDDWASPFIQQSSRLGHARMQSSDEILDESDMGLLNADFSTVWAQHVSQRFADVISTKRIHSQDAVLEQMPDTPRSLESISSDALSKLVAFALHDRQPEEVPVLVEVMLRKVIEEFERRLLMQEEQCKGRYGPLSCDPCVHPETDEPLAGQQIDHIHQLQMELDEAQKTNENRGHILKSQSEEIQILKEQLKAMKHDFRSVQAQWRNEMEALDIRLQGLAQAAAEYHKVAAENRDLYNQVQDLKGNIRVYCRVRPFLPGQTNTQSTVDYVGEKGSIMIVNPNKQGKDQRKMFNFNKVFGPTAAQEEVFLDTQPLIRSVLDGFNVCIFAYGQTGSGKTYTMTGPNKPSPKDWGVNFRALNDLFDISQKRRDFVKYEVGVQMMEIYNEQVRDLLCSDGLNKKLEIRNSSQQNGLNVPDATMLPVQCTEDVLEFMNLGHKNRAVGSTALNERSSRSHSVLTVHVKGTDLNSGAILRGCLHLVDLAGSERVDKSEVTGDRLKEAQHINKSLSALGDVIAALAQKNAHVPYRNSKLTQLLQDSLGGQAKTLMFVHVSPDEESYSETISTLKFAERVATVELGQAQSNKESGDVRDLKDQIAFLKDALAKKEAELENIHKELKLKTIDNLQEKSKMKTGSSPCQVQARRTSVDVSQGQQATQGKRRQPLEEVRNSEIRPSPLNVNIVQKCISPADVHPLSFEALSPSLFGNEYSEDEYVKLRTDEDSCKRRATKVLRQSDVYADEQIPSPAGGLESRVFNKNKIKRDGSADPLPSSTPHEKASKDDQASTPSAKTLPSVVNMVFNSGRHSSIEKSVRKSHIKPFSVQDHERDAKSTEAASLNIDEEAEASECSEDLDTWQKEMCSIASFATTEVQETKDSKRRSGERRLHSVKQSLSALPKAEAQRRSRRFSLTGSQARKAAASKRVVGSTTVEAKVVTVSSEGSTVECYAKATVPRQSAATAAISVQKASKRWM